MRRDRSDARETWDSVGRLLESREREKMVEGERKGATVIRTGAGFSFYEGPSGYVVPGLGQGAGM